MEPRLLRKKSSTQLARRGVDLVMETSGVWPGFEQAFAICREYSRIALMGIYRRTPTAEYALKLHKMLYAFPSKLHYKKIEVVGCGYDPEETLPDSPFTFDREGNFRYLLEQAGRGKIDLNKLVTHRFQPDGPQPCWNDSRKGSVHGWRGFRMGGVG
ncbi:MAG: hypothetical protein R2848_16000 [Thermomicrobiales bacterium]